VDKDNNKSPKNKKRFLLDTNIIEYSMNKFIGPVVAPILESKKADFFISEITFYELLKGADKDKIAEVYKRILKIKRLDITKEVLVLAAIFENMYKQEHTKQKKNPEIVKKAYSDIDKIIAATSFIENIPLITGDFLDFPRPFFRETDWLPLNYKKNKRPVTNHICILKPASEIIKRGIKKIFV